MNEVASDGTICLRPPNVEAVWHAPKSPDVAHEHERWIAPASAMNADTRYFSVYEGTRLVGQIFLHDIDARTGEALTGYHLFEPQFRGRGIGTVALALLQRFVVASTSLTRLVIITSEDNYASRRIAEKCGFVFVGPARESPHWIVLHWDVSRS